MHLASHTKFSTRVLNLVLNLVARVKKKEQADEQAIDLHTMIQLYEKIPDQTAPGPARGRVAKSNPAFPGTVFLKITSMGNLSEN